MTAPTYGASYGEGKVQGVVKTAQTGILWSQVQVLVGPPIVKKPLILKSVAFFIEHSIAYMETVSPSNFLRIIKKASVSEILGD